jgi:hypothetical protein
MKMLVGTILTITLLGLASTSPLYAIDEDYFIPYTDNYGYEYDPETGTYIKKDNPAPTVADNQTPVSGTGNTNVSANQQAMSVTQTTSAETVESPSSLPFIFAGVIVILGLVMVITRIQKKAN